MLVSRSCSILCIASFSFYCFFIYKSLAFLRGLPGLFDSYLNNESYGESYRSSSDIFFYKRLLFYCVLLPLKTELVDEANRVAYRRYSSGESSSLALIFLIFLVWRKIFSQSVFSTSCGRAIETSTKPEESKWLFQCWLCSK
jgi:hypothetical protein